jgi:hypothetical protein
LPEATFTKKRERAQPAQIPEQIQMSVTKQIAFGAAANGFSRAVVIVLHDKLLSVLHKRN